MKNSLFAIVLLLAISCTSIKRKKILIVLSEKSEISLKSGKTHKTGFYLNELMIPVMELEKNNYELVFATPNGGIPSLDKSSDRARYFENEDEYQNAKSSLNRLELTKFNNTVIKSLKDLSSSEISNFSGLFVPGGHAPMIDLAFNSSLGAVLKKFNKSKIPTAMVCHGPVALLSSLDNSEEVILEKEDGKNWIYKDYKMTVFSNEEEKVAEKYMLKDELLFYSESALKRAGAQIVVGDKWKSNVVVHNELITGQNPSSDKDLVLAFINLLENK